MTKLITIFLIFLIWLFLTSVYRQKIRKQLFGFREPLPLKTLYDDLIKDYRLEYSNFQKVFEKLGECYSIDPRLIRPDDPLKKFIDIDSWDIGLGTE